MIFQDKWVFVFIPLVCLFLYYLRNRSPVSGVKFSSSTLLLGLRSTLKLRLYGSLIYMRTLAILFMILALARPQKAVQESRVRSEGIDIVIALDVSTSMRACDFKWGGRPTDRLEVVKKVVVNFVKGRQNDRIGMVVFAARAYTVCPLTLDYGWLLKNLERVKTGMIEDGTAIGSGLSSALNRLKDTRAKGKVVILLTDGINNMGKISPLTAAEAARALGVKVYTIGAGTKGLAPYPVKDFFGNIVYQPVRIDLDEDTLIKIASRTGGRYFRATDTESLAEIYKEIDKMEKTPVEEIGFTEYKELFPIFLIPGLILFSLEIILENTFLRRIP